jgi:hypothetical protein
MLECECKTGSGKSYIIVFWDVTLLSLVIQQTVMFIVTARETTNIMGKMADFLLRFYNTESGNIDNILCFVSYSG